MRSIFNRLQRFSFFDTFKHASVYFSGTVLIQALSLISLPVYTAYLTDAEYGIVNMFSSYALVLALLMTLNIHIGITRYYFEAEANPDDFKGYMATTTFSVTALSFVIGLLIYIFRQALAELINLPEQTIIYMLFMCYLSVLYYVYHQWKVAEKKSKAVTTVQVVLQFSKFGLSLLLLMLVHWAPEQFFMGKIIGEFLAALVTGIVLFVLTWPMLNWKGMRWSHLRYGLLFGLPLIPYTLGMYFLNSFDQWYIGAKLGHSDAGLYSFAYKIGLLLGGLISALHSAAIPDYYKWMNEEKHENVRAQALSIHRLTALAATFLLLFATDIGTLLSSKKDFIQALEIAPVIVGGYLFFGIAQLFNRGIQYKKTNIYLTFIYLFAGIINLLLNIYYIPIYGYPAAAWTTFASYIIMAISSWLLTTYYLKLPSLPVFKMLINLLPFTLTAVFFYFSGWYKIGLDWGIILLKLLLFGMITLVIFGKSILKILRK